MKGITVWFAVAALAMSAHGPADAQMIRFESQNRIVVDTAEDDSKEAGDFDARVNLYVRKAIQGPFTATAFATVAEGYAVGYTGIAYAPVPEVELEQSIGVETASTHPRFESSLFAATGPLTALSIFEYGDGTESWWTARIVYKVHPHVSLAAMWQRYDGYGPRLILNGGPHGFSMWIAGLRDNEANRNNLLFGIRRVF